MSSSPITLSATTEGGTTARLTREDHGTFIVLETPERTDVAGQIVDGAFLPALHCAFAMRPDVLRAIADLIRINDHMEAPQ